MPGQDQEWPLIRKDLVAKLDAYIAETKLQQKNHHDALYGFMDDKGKWRNGIIQTVQDSEERRMALEKKISWVIYGTLTAAGIGFFEVIVRFWKFVMNQH